MSGVSSLLKYRYQKRTSADQSSSNQSSPTCTSSNSITQIVSGKPQSGSCNSTSPIFPAKFSKSQHPKDDGTSASASQTSSSSSAIALSKLAAENSRSSKECGVARAKFLSKARFDGSKQFIQLDDSDDNSQSGLENATCSLDPREFQAKVNSLSEMFPGVENSHLAEALKETKGDVDSAIDIVIKQKKIDEDAKQRKRKYAIFQPSQVLSSPETSPCVPQSKRARKLSSSDDESSDALPKFEKHNTKEAKKNAEETRQIADGTHPPSSNGHSDGEQPDAYVIYERMKFLQGAFPNISRQELKRVLTVSNYNLEVATATLTSYQTGEPISQTKNVGSIKAFMASRAQAKAVSSSAVQQGVSDGSSPKKMERRNILAVESDSDTEAKVEEDQEIGSKSVNQLVLEFFNSATLDELTIMNGCSRKKAETLVKMRPFSDWNDLVTKIDNCQSLPSYLIGEGHEVIKLRNVVSDLMERCQQISNDLGAFVADLTSRTSIDSNDNEHNYLAVQPSCLSPSVMLKPYQLVGLNWLLMMHAHDLNGILGDEMGLGKTIQTIAFLAQLFSEGIDGPHIIIAPSSTIDNWLRELQLWCPAMRVLLYYGNQEYRRAIRNDLLDGIMDDFQILLTTYNMASGSTEDRILFKKLKFYYAVFDEGHMLKNMDSMRYRSLTRIIAKRRLLLTGTPLQNNLTELMSLLVFLMPHLFVGKTDTFKRIFTTFTTRGTSDARGTYEREALTQAKQILKPFFLRRLKSEVLDQLPQKSAFVHVIALSFEQQELYDGLLRDYARDIDNNETADKDGSGNDGKSAQPQQQSGSAMMMQLRKAANHHLLHRRQYDDSRLRQMAQLMLEEPTHKDADVNYVFEDMQVMSDFELHKLCTQYEVLKPFRLDQETITDSGKFRHFDEVLPAMKSKGDRVLVFSQFTMMLDIIEEYMSSRQYKYLRLDGSTPVSERQDLIDKFNSDTSIFIFLLSTKAGGLGINLTAANVVIIHDIDFNPYNDKQAEDRCHRVGQNRCVSIHRLISKNTIEEAMLRCAEAKLKLEMDVTGTGDKESDEMESVDVVSLLKEALQMRSSS